VSSFAFSGSLLSYTIDTSSPISHAGGLLEAK
jgi:hypothetical protein